MTDEELVLDKMENTVYLAIGYLNSRTNWVYFGMAEDLATSLGITIDKPLIKKLAERMNANPQQTLFCGQVTKRNGEWSLKVINPNGRD